ncbi:MAG: tetratricopeptide repeat protein [Flavipsychrobacter sp.]|nr:tetratricopeptide repeat protein [Flavipsychrobacter sp.]
MKKYISLFIVLVGVCGNTAHAQNQADALIRQGNKLYEQQKYNDAAADYQKALTKNPNYTPGLFNLGNSLYQQQKFDASRQVMTATANATKDKTAKAGVNYNIGNTYMAEKKWEDAVNSYKQTLRNNPQDLDAKYNLSYAEQMLKKQQQQGGGGSKDQKKDDKKDKNKDKQNQKQNKDDKGKDKDKDKQNQDQQNKDNKDDKDKQDQQPQSQPSKLTQQQADQVLNALQNEEKKLQDKLNKEKGIPARMDKDW